MTDFFDQLSEFSQRVFQSLGIDETECPWTSGPFRGGHPKGAVLHYTAGNNIDKTLRWFMKRKYNARSSAHAVVADGWPEGMRELAADLPLINSLPAMVVQCVPPDQIAWHATWTNSFCYGVEAVNVGELRRLPDGTWVSHHKISEQAREWTMPWEHETKEPMRLFGRHWEPWTAEQLHTIAIMLWEVQTLHGTLRPEWVLGHENVQGMRTLRSETGVRLPFGTDKRDPGPGFPLEAVRRAISYSGDTRPTWNHAARIESEPRFGEKIRTKWIQQWWRPAERPPGDAIWSHFRESLPGFVDSPGFGEFGKLCLRILGYHISSNTADLTEVDLESVWIFQRMMGLETDKQPGPKTRRAIVSRLADRGFATQEATMEHLVNRDFPSKEGLR